MTFEELWNHIAKRNPAMAAEKITLSRDNLEKLCKAFYDEGEKQGQGGDNVMASFFAGLGVKR